MNNLLKRKSWLIRPKENVLQAGINTIGVKWVFEKKMDYMEPEDKNQG